MLLAGDVVESDRDFFEAFGQLRKGVDKLTAAGVQVIAVAGNHDVLVLPRLADLLEGSGNFKLLGREGKWEAHEVHANGEQLILWGWSFREKTQRGSPLVGTHFERQSTLQLGLLHCDLDQQGSPYAPVSSSELNASGLHGWLLGHIHKPDELRPDSLCGYLGCLSGMDPGEHGVRGPWMLQVKGGQIREVTQVPLAPLRWVRSELDVSELEDIGELETLLINHVEKTHENISTEAMVPKAVGIRLTFVGRSPFASAYHAWIEENREQLPYFHHLDIQYFVGRCESAVFPEIQLEELAKQQNPLGLLCKRVLLLDGPPEVPERKRLIAAAKQRFGKALDGPTWRGLESNSEQLSEASVVSELRGAALRTINQLHTMQQGRS